MENNLDDLIRPNRSITFDKEAQNNLPEHIKDKMKADREKAQVKKIDYEKKFNDLKALVQSDSVYWCLRNGVKNPSNFDFDDSGYVELYNWIRLKKI